MGKLFVKDRDFYRLVFTMAAPVVLQNLITVGVNMMDTLMLGTYGEIQISGSSLANEYINIFHILCMGMGCGAAVLTAQYWGKGEIAPLKKVVSIMLRLSMGISLCFMLSVLIWPEGIMRIFTPEADIIEKGALYFRVSAATFPMMGISQTLTMVLRSARQVRLPLVTSIIAFFVNIFFNWVFIFGNLGAPEMQIAGAALGTVIARVVEAGIIGGYFLYQDARIGYRWKDLLAPCRDLLPTYLKYSVPVLVSDGLLALGNSAVAVVMGHIGASFVAANAIVSQTVRLSTVFNQGISNASSNITGNTLGQGEPEKAYRQGVTFLAMSVIVGLLAGMIILLLCPLLINNFSITQETREIAFALMQAVAVMVVFQTVQGMMTKGVLRGGGDTRFLMLADVLFLWLASVPLGYLAGLVLHLPPFWIYIALKIDWAIKSVWCIFRLRSRKWIYIVTSQENMLCIAADGE